ncbi:hypothetical protein K1719_018386 [Acacia pycnantha]|nr:hypothetical protein K1719_018386 [Acacia pycnantha]
MEEENREVGDSRRMFGSLGTVDGVDIIRTKGRSFAYVDFIPSPTDQNSLSKLFSRYNCLWKGGKLKLEKAKEHYLVRLKREWEEDAKLASSDEPGTSPDPDDSISSTEMPSKKSLKTKKLRIFFPKLRKVKSIPFTGTGKHKYSFPKVEVPPLPVHFCNFEERSCPSGTIGPMQFLNGEAGGGGMNDEEINIMNVVINKIFERENLSSPTHIEKEQNSDVSPGGLQYDESEADSASDDDGLIINMETKRKKTDIIGSLELERILRNQESELNKAKVLKDEPNKNKLEVQKRNDIAPDKKRKPRSGFSEPTKVSWSQKSSRRELLGDGGRSSFNASHMLLDSNSSEKQGSDSFCEPESAKNKTEHIEMEGGEEIEPAKAEVMEELAEARPTIQNTTSKESGRVAKEPAGNLAGSGNAEYFDLAKESNDEFVGDGFNLVNSGPEKKHSVLAKHASIESIGDGLNMTRSTPEKSQHVAGNDIASAPINEEKCDTLTNETSTTEIKIGETCSFMRNAASLKEWVKTKAALSGSLKRKRGEKK